MRYYYVYRITNILLNKHYYGKRTSTRHPKNDLGYYYFSSSRDAQFMFDQKQNPQHFKYKVIKICETPVEAIELEIKLHKKFDVAKNTYFYNRSKQLSTGFSTTGMSVWKGRTHSEQAKQKIAASRKLYTGWKHTEQTKEKMRNANKGPTHHRAKLVNIYDYITGNLVADSVSLRSWCKENKYTRALLLKTLKADRSLPHSVHNKHFYKNLYAEYVNV